MKYSTIFSLSLSAVLLGCSAQQIRKDIVRTPSSSEIGVNWVQHVRENVYEVVIPKLEDTDIKYEKALPFDKLPYKERTDKYISIGTAFSVEKNKFISAGHVIAPQAKLPGRTYYLRDSVGNIFKVKDVLRFSLSHDLIEFTLETSPKNESVLKISQIPNIGEAVYTFGNAQGEGISIRGGQVATVTPEAEDGRWNNIRYSAPASPGNSGGPLLNAKGEVVGVITMKNGSENLNYAIPIDELFKLPKDKALFQKKNFPVNVFHKTSSGHINYTLDLPQSFEELTEEAFVEMRNTFKGFYQKLLEENKNELFPYASGSQDYLKNQFYQSQPSFIYPENAEKWGFRKTDYKNYDLGNDRYYSVWSLSKESLFLNVPKPENISLAEFVSSPEVILDQVFQISNIPRQVGEEKVRILSYGKPHETKFTIDELGRPGFNAKWRHLYSMRTTTLGCIAIPTGVSCSFNDSITAYENMYNEDISNFYVRLMPLSYQGSLKQWKEFLALDRKFLPKVFHDSSFEFSAGKNLKYEFGKLALKFGPTNEFDDQSNLFVKVGYSLNLPLKQEIHGVNLKPRSDKATQYVAGIHFKPSDNMGSDLKKRWNEIVQGKAPFDGQIFVNNGVKTALFPRVAHGREVATGSVIFDRAYLGVCLGDSTLSELQMKEQCSSFIKGLKFYK